MLPFSIPPPFIQKNEILKVNGLLSSTKICAKEMSLLVSLYESLFPIQYQKQIWRVNEIFVNMKLNLLLENIRGVLHEYWF